MALECEKKCSKVNLNEGKDRRFRLSSSNFRINKNNATSVQLILLSTANIWLKKMSLHLSKLSSDRYESNYIQFNLQIKKDMVNTYEILLNNPNMSRRVF